MQAHLSEGAIEVDVATDEHIPHIRVLHLTEHLHPILKKKKRCASIQEEALSAYMKTYATPECRPKKN